MGSPAAVGSTNYNRTEITFWAAVGWLVGLLPDDDRFNSHSQRNSAHSFVLERGRERHTHTLWNPNYFWLIKVNSLSERSHSQ